MSENADIQISRKFTLPVTPEDEKTTERFLEKSM